MGMLDKIKKEIKRSSSGMSDIFYLGDGDKAKVRFLTEVEDFVEVKWHDSYEDSIDAPCLKYFGADCPHCNSDNENLRTRNMYCATIYNHDEGGRQIFKYAANRFSPIPALISMYETYSSILTRDFVISRTGTSFDIDYSVVPMDKSEFKKSAEEFTKKEMFEKFKIIHNIDIEMEDMEDDEEFEMPF